MRVPGLTTTIRLAARGTASAGLAWERYADPELWPTWSPQIRRVDLGGATRIAAGVKGKVYSYAPVPLSVKILKVDESLRTWTWEARLGLIKLHLDHGIDAGAMDTTTWLLATGPTPVVLAYAPLAEIALRKLVAP